MGDALEAAEKTDTGVRVRTHWNRLLKRQTVFTHEAKQGGHHTKPRMQLGLLSSGHLWAGIELN